MPGLLSLRLHMPDCYFEMAHLKSGNGPDVRAIERDDHWAAFDAAQPMWAGVVEDLQTIRGPGETTSNARVVGGLACRQAHAHHAGGLPERQLSAEFRLDAHKLWRGSSFDQLRCLARTTCMVAARLRLAAA